MNILEWIIDPANWSGDGSIPFQTMMHLMYSVAALALALLIAVPLGVYIGHTGKGESLIMGSANAMRALPTLGLLILLVLIIAPKIGNSLAFVIPTLIVLILLAVPPILGGVVSGIQAIDRSVIDAARGMGLSDRQIIWKVELPCALPLTLSGVRGATLQVVSTAVVAAYVSLDGLGRFIIDGRAANDYAEMAGGSLIIALLAVALELGFAFASSRFISPGLTRRKVAPRARAMQSTTTLINV
ncbi:ABC transporter permease [Leucobacter chinensis]|uniref:ABC transporter permease n=1 Tax=Leucobacter chinensis TaxID=2851010 RepID=UPI001C22B112|nr:ABC transporter permease subunit [Leucobacter chinensis]